jgi:hypothetical protein
MKSLLVDDGRRIVEYPRVNVKPQVMFWRMMFEDRLVERPAVVPDNPLKPIASR